MSVGKVNGVYYFSVRYKDINGKVKQKKVQNKEWRTQREAKEAERQFLERVHPTGDMLLSSWFEFFMDSKRIQNRETTVKRDEGIYRIYIAPYFGDTPMSSLSKTDVKRWQTKIAQMPLSARSIYVIQQKMKQILDQAVKYDIIPRNPLLEIIKKEEEKKEYAFFTLEEFSQYLSVITDVRDRAFFSVLFFCGLRLGEILGLQIKDYSDGKLNINKQFTISLKYDKVKNKNGNRVIGLDDFTKSCIDEMLTHYVASPEDGLFHGYNFSRSAIRRRNDEYIKKAGVKRIRLHDFRHSHATFLLRMGYSYPDVAKRLGDTVDTIIKVYGHPYDDSDDRIVSTLNSESVTKVLRLQNQK